MENQGVIASKTIPIYAYGLELLYSSLAGVVALIIISAILGKPFLWIPYLAGFVPLRLSGGGYHAKTHFHCIFTFSLLYSLVLVIEIMCTVPMKAWLFPCLTNLIIILLFSPVEAPNKPLKENQCRKNRCNSLILGLTNLLGFIVLDFLYTTQYSWVNTARCDYSYYTVTEADVCAAGHTTNRTTTRHEFGHTCMYPGR